MRKFVFAAAIVSLAACGSKEEAPPAPAETDYTGIGDTATGDMTGTYEVKNADGSVVIETINADGTYVDATPDGAETERGTWRQDGANMCFDPAGDAPEACFAGGAPGPDGSFEIRDAQGNVASTFRKIEADAGNAMAPAQ